MANYPFHIPPVTIDANNNPRKVGFEFEFGNLTVIKTAEALHRTLGGLLTIHNPFRAEITDTVMGKLKIERDQHLLSSVSYRSYFEELGIDFSKGSIAHEIEMNLDNASSIIVPCEVITDPIPFEQLPVLDTLVKTLDDIDAMGTQDSLTYAYGLHFNPTAPDLNSATLLSYLQAYLLCSDLIIEDSQTDITRRYLTNYIDRFPGAYIEIIMDRNYQPTIAELIKDYLKFNPTRNRALDMLPLFCEIDKALVFKHLKGVETKLVKSRPTFHYRLPDCRLGHPHWSPALAWNQWVMIEKVANNRAILNQLIDEFPPQTFLYPLDGKSRWIQRSKKILKSNNCYYDGSLVI